MKHPTCYTVNKLFKNVCIFDKNACFCIFNFLSPTNDPVRAQLKYWVLGFNLTSNKVATISKEYALSFNSKAYKNNG